MVSIISLHPVLLCALGAFFVVLLAFITSVNRALISYKHLLITISFEIALAFAMLKTNIGIIVLNWLSHLTALISQAAQEGIVFVFGKLGTQVEPWGFVFALHALPIIIFFSALVAGISYLGIIDFFIRIFSRIVRPVLGTTSPETMNATARSFLGPTESLLLIRDYLATMSVSELFAVMVSSLCMTSAALFAIYIAMGVAAKHIIAASIMGVPGSLLFAKIIMPAGYKDKKIGDVKEVIIEKKSNNLVEALIKGTLDGLQLVLAIAAILISFLAIIALLNMIFVYVGSFFGIADFTFQKCIGYLFAPFGFLMGVGASEAIKISELIGIKVLANELVAFAEIAGSNLSERGLTLATYALCGFGNLASIGIAVGSIGTLVPERRSELSMLAWHALLAATLANLFSAYIVGMII